jgi:hypothetical protein
MAYVHAQLNAYALEHDLPPPPLAATFRVLAAYEDRQFKTFLASLSRAAVLFQPAHQSTSTAADVDADARIAAPIFARPLSASSSSSTAVSISSIFDESLVSAQETLATNYTQPDAAAGGGSRNKFGELVTLSRDGAVLVVATEANGAPAVDANDPRLLRSVYVYRRAARNLPYVLETPLYVNNTSYTSTGFGSAVALSSDGWTVVVGAPFADRPVGATPVLDNGAIFSWRWNGRQRQSIDWTLGDSEDFTDTMVGMELALSGDGNFMLVTSVNDGASQVRLLQRFAEHPPRYLPIRVYTSVALNSAVAYGSALALDGEGRVLAIGAPRELFNSSLLGVGAVQIYHRRVLGSVLDWYPTATLWPTPLEAQGRFGTQVYLNEAGDHLYVRAYNVLTEVGKVYVFQRNPLNVADPYSWTQIDIIERNGTSGNLTETFGSWFSVSALGNRLAVSAERARVP